MPNFPLSLPAKGSVKNYWNWSRIDIVTQPQCSLCIFTHVMCAHIQDDDCNFSTNACVTYSRLKWHKIRNTSCGMWHLPHSEVHNNWTVPIIMAGCNAHAGAQNGRTSTSGLKSDVTVVFLGPNFIKRKNFSDSCIFRADIGLLNICMDFQDLLA